VIFIPMERNITIFITDGIDSEEYIFLKEIVLSFFYNKLSKGTNIR
jgi:hypothetical protein